MATVTYSWSVAAPSFQLNQNTAGNQGEPAVAGVAGGLRYLALWTNPSATDLAGRIVHSVGTPLAGEFTPNAAVAGEQRDASVAGLVDGNAVLAFTDLGGGGIRVRRLSGVNALPVGTEVNADPTGSGSDRESDVAPLADGGFVVSWTRFGGTGGDQVYAQVFNAEGSYRSDAPVVAASSAFRDTTASSVAGLAGGNFVVAWQQKFAGVPGHSDEVYFRRFTPGGQPIDADGVLIDTTGSINEDVQVAALPDGGFVVAYTDSGWNIDGTEITARVYNADGSARTGFIRVNNATAGDQNKPSLTTLSNGFFAVSWSDGAAMRMQVFDPNGNEAGSEFSIFPGVVEAEIAALRAGLIATLRSSTITDGDGDSIRTAVLELARTLTGNDSSDILTGDSLRDAVIGNGGNDTLNGAGGNDSLTGGFGNDTFVYTPGGGVDVITDAAIGAGSLDRVDLTAFANINALGDVLALAIQSGSNTVLQFESSHFLVLQNVQKAHLSHADFVELAARPTNDFSGEGRADILWRHDNGTSNVFTMDGAQVQGGSNTSLQVDNNWAAQDKNDFNGDGKADILWRHANGTSNIFLMDGATVIGGSNTTLQVDNNWTVQDTGDFNGDGRADILWRHSNGTSNVFLMDGSTVVGGSNTTQQVDTNWTVQGAGDFDGDGRADILWRHANGTSNVFTMNGASVIGGSNTSLAVDNNWTVQGVADFNGDGRTDILWRHANGTSNVFLMNGATVVGDGNLSLQVDNNWTVQDTGDYNGDGRADILWRHANGTTNVFLMDGTTVIGGSNTSLQIGNDWHVV